MPVGTYTRNGQDRIAVPSLWLETLYPSVTPTVKWQTNNSSSFTWTRQGQMLKDWKLRIRRRENAGTVYVVDRYSFPVHEPGEFTAYKPRTLANGQKVIDKLYFRGFYDAPPALASPSHSASVAYENALIQIHKKIKSARQEWKSLIAIAEFSEGRKMILDRSRKMSKGLVGHLQSLAALKQSFKRLPKRLKDAKGREKLKNDLSNLHLEFSFGWLPLAADVQDASKALARFVVESESGFFKKSKMVRSKSNHEVLTAQVLQQIQDPYWPNIFAWRRTKQISNSLVRFQALLEWSVNYPSDAITQAQKLSGFEMNEFVPTLWEWCPWSFLVDYFTNIGDLVEASTTVTGDVKWLNYSVLRSNIWENQVYLDATRTPSTYVIINENGDTPIYGKDKAVRNKFERYVNMRLDLPMFKWEMPGLIPKWTWDEKDGPRTTKAANILALTARFINLQPLHK